MNPVSRMVSLAANLLWLAACVPGALAFWAALRWPRLAQRRILRATLRRNRDTAFGRRHRFARIRGEDDFARLPVASYEAFRADVDGIRRGRSRVLTAEPVTILQPTSGSSAAPKLIPLTRGLQREFQAALAPWIASLYLLRPPLLIGRQYWCVSPNTRPAQPAGSLVPVGFADDTDYLGCLPRWISRQVLIAPPALARVNEPATFEFLTLLFLAREPNLRLISVWHPSFLTQLIDALWRHAPALASSLHSGVLPAWLTLGAEVRAVLQAEFRRAPERAALVQRITGPNAEDIAGLWSRLQVISCWGGEASERWLSRLKAWFPHATIQSKGLLATEGVLTIPWGFGGQHVCAIRSHYLEFAEIGAAGERVHPVWKLKEGRTYSVVLTTGGGLYRYRLGDRVRVTGWIARTPCLEFLGREGFVSDLCGEKVTIEDAESAVERLRLADPAGAPAFAMLVPDHAAAPPGYVLVVECDPLNGMRADASCQADLVEAALLENYHYRHARQLGQLRAARILTVPGDATAQARAWLVRRGLRHGDIKFPALRTEPGWLEAFRDATIWQSRRGT